MSKPKIKVSGKVQNMAITNTESKKVVPKKTNFLLTMNLNQSYKPDDPNLQNDIEIFDGVIQDILNNLDQYINLPDGTQWNDDIIKDVKCDYVIERGLKFGFLHTHIMISIEHFTNVKLDYAKVKDKVKNELGLINFHLNNKIIKNNGNVNILEYLDKYV
jgi:hypothetical protein